MAWSDSPSKDVPYYPTYYINLTSSAFTATSEKITIYLKFLHLEQKTSPHQSITSLCPLYTGGLGAPNIAAYYKAVILEQIKHWWLIERLAPHSPPKNVLSAMILKYKPAHHSFTSIAASLLTWSSKTQLTTGIPTHILHSLPIAVMELLSPEVKVSTWTQSCIRQIGDLCNNSLLLSFQELQQKFNIDLNDFYKYLHIRAILQALKLKNNNLLSDILQPRKESRISIT